jgi:phenylalanyl-tRNA synthetase alpha chain
MCYKFIAPTGVLEENSLHRFTESAGLGLRARALQESLVRLKAYRLIPGGVMPVIAKESRILCEIKVVPRSFASSFIGRGFFIFGRNKMKKIILELEERSLAEIALASNLEQVEAARLKYLGKKGELTGLLKQMGKVSPEERPVIGALINSLREKLTEAITSKKADIEAQELKRKLTEDSLDITLPAKGLRLGKKHPLTLVIDEMKELFLGMGFSIYDGPEIELSEYNFDRLNSPANHPSREWTDTFYLDPLSQTLLRAHTSSMEPRIMESVEPPIKAAVFGRCYRKDEVDATHSPMFHQMEGLYIDKGISFANLKSSLHKMATLMYGPDTKTRFRPHHFPFTEPSCEMDVQCHECGGIGCRICKGEGWIELLGAGVCNPKILKMSGIDPEIYSGWAFGMGLERAAMRRFNISDLRLLFENDLRFLEQF